MLVGMSPLYILYFQQYCHFFFYFIVIVTNYVAYVWVIAIIIYIKFFGNISIIILYLLWSL